MINVAILEDQPYIAMSLNKLVQACNLDAALICHSGEEFLELARDNEFKLLLIDINLKGRMTGIEVAKMLRAHSECPIIFISGMLTDHISEIRQISNSTSLEKPLDFVRAKEMIKLLTSA